MTNEVIKKCNIRKKIISYREMTNKLLLGSGKQMK